MSNAFKAGFLMAGEGSAESAAVAAAGLDPGWGCEIMGMPQAIAAFSAGCPCVRQGPCALISANQQHLSLVNLLFLEVI